MGIPLVTDYTLGEANAKVGRESAAHARRQSVRNIGTIPVIVDIGRRKEALKTLESFGLTYWGDQMWPLSIHHKKFLRRVELIIRKGGRAVIVLPRGFGKSVWSRIAVLFAECNGLRQFCPLLAANGTHADNNYSGCKSLIETPSFAEDFPEVAFPITCLEGITHRCSGQTYTNKKGEVESTNVEYSANRILLPSTDGAYDSLGKFHKNKARNAVIISQGLFAAVRGLSVVIWDGSTLRPDFAICDDPQDEESAVSPVQIAKRLRVIKNSLLGSGGHNKGLALAMPATIIAENDLVEQLLADPAWPGDRVAFFEKTPDTLETMWLSKYRRIREDYDKSDPDDKYAAINRSTEFYRENQAEMDEGAVVAWEECYSRDEGEISAVQHGMNALIDLGEEYFNCELQNKPRKEVVGENLTVEALIVATNRLKRGLVPGWATKITSAIDVHDNILYHTTIAWNEENFSGQVIDYGEYPPQVTDSFKQSSVTNTLQNVFKGMSKEAAIRAGLDSLIDKMTKIRFKSQDGSDRHIDRIHIDSGYLPEVIYGAILENDARLFYPSRGEYCGAKNTEYNTVTRSKKNQNKSDIITFGDGWRACRVTKYRDLQRVFYDANFWKTFIRARFLAPDGAEGALRVFEYRHKHDLFYDHLLAEKGVEVEAKGRKVTEWENPFRRDNHWFDCIVYCAIAAGIAGCVIKGTELVKGSRKERERRRIGYG